MSEKRRSRCTAHPLSTAASPGRSGRSTMQKLLLLPRALRILPPFGFRRYSNTMTSGPLARQRFRAPVHAADSFLPCMHPQENAFLAPPLNRGGAPGPDSGFRWAFPGARAAGFPTLPAREKAARRFPWTCSAERCIIKPEGHKADING